MQGVTLPAPFTLIEMGTVGSTNEEAKILARQGEENAPEGTLIWAQEQTAGKGRSGRDWVSPKGNFHASLILRPECGLGEAPQLSFVAGLALFDAIGSVAEAGHQVALKWPNDVLLSDRKVGGILIESEGGTSSEPPDFVVVGTGVNLIHAPDPSQLGETGFPATSLALEGVEVGAGQFLEAYSKSFLSWVRIWAEEGFEKIRRNWLYRSHGKGKDVFVQMNGTQLNGTFEDLDIDGALIVKTADGTERVLAGDVFFQAHHA